jgi:Zn-dependent protease with chaperone function
MPILLVFALTAACLPIDWPAPLLGGGVRFAASATTAVVVVSLLAAITVRVWVVRTLRRDPSRKSLVVGVYSRFRRFMFFGNLALITLCVLVFGWGWATHELLVVEWNGRPRLAPFAELAVPLPYFIILFGAWLIYFDAERALHRTLSFGPVNRVFFGRASFFFHQLRQFGLLVMLPVMLFVTYQSIARFLPETARSNWYRVTSVALIPVLILLMPLLIKPILGLKSMPAGPIRDRLEAIGRRLQFKCTDFLMWPTHGATANAMIVGLLPRVRYVIFTDRILEELPPEEVEAVLGHEVGHSRHGHIWHYAAFLALSMAALSAAFVLIGQRLDQHGVEMPHWFERWIALPPVMLAAIYVFLVFGFLSRRCERQADIFGCRTVSCVDSNCVGHHSNTVFPERPEGLCPTGIRTFIRALERVDFVNDAAHHYSPPGKSTTGERIRGFFKWLRSWQHSTMSRRVAFLQSLIGNPHKERMFQMRVTALRWGLLMVLAVALIALGEAVGWSVLLKAL